MTLIVATKSKDTNNILNCETFECTNKEQIEEVKNEVYLYNTQIGPFDGTYQCII